MRVSSHEFHTGGVRTRTLRARLIASMGILVGVMLTAFATPAFAHDELIGSTPAAGSTVDEMPAEITLTFSGVLLDEPGATDIEVLDASCTPLTAGDAALDGVRLSQSVSTGATGAITVVWRVVSSDGHPISDTFTFTVDGAGDTVPCADLGTATSAPDDDSTHTGGDGLRIVWIIIGVVAIGLAGVLIRVVVARSRDSRED